MSVKGYQLEACLVEFRDRYGLSYKKVQSESLEISEEAKNNGHLVGDFLKTNQSASWVTPQNVLNFLNRESKYAKEVEYELERRAFKFLEPYVRAPKGVKIQQVYDYLENFERGIAPPQAEQAVSTNTFIQQAGNILDQAEQTSIKHAQLEAKRKKAEIKRGSKELEADYDDPFEDEGRHYKVSDEDVIYGSGKITPASTRAFIKQYPDTAVKFFTEQDLNGKSLPESVLNLYDGWVNRGLNKNRVKKIIFDLMGWKQVPDNLANIEFVSMIRDKYLDQDIP